MNSIGFEQYQKLLPLTVKLYEHFNGLATKMLLPLFLLSILCAYTADLGISGATIYRIRRLVVTALLLVAFPTIANTIQAMGREVAAGVDNMSGLDQIIQAASKKADSYSFDVKSILTMTGDFAVSLLVMVSYIILFFARYIILAFYHFYWLLLVALAPLLILGNLFEATSGITKNLFKNLFQVAMWPVLWAVLSLFLKAMPFSDAYQIEGAYATVVVMNLIIAVSLLLSPFLVSNFTNGVIFESADRVGARAKSVTAGTKHLITKTFTKADPTKVTTAAHAALSGGVK